MSKAVQYKGFFPGIPSWNWMMMLEAMTFKVYLEVPPDCDVNPKKIIVQAWTSQYDRFNAEGKWHAIDLLYFGSEDGRHHCYGQSVVITSAMDFNFTFRMKCPGDKDWRWSHGYGEDGFVHVEAPWLHDKWTQGPDFDHIMGAVYCGNFIAATNAKDCGLTHVLNVADNLDMVYPEGGVTYRKVPTMDGAHNPINDEQIKEAVQWLLDNDQEDNKILVNCRAGIGRAGSIAVAFVFARCPNMSYEEAYDHVYSRRFVYPHKGLRDALYRLFPRSM